MLDRTMAGTWNGRTRAARIARQIPNSTGVTGQGVRDRHCTARDVGTGSPNVPRNRSRGRNDSVSAIGLVPGRNSQGIRRSRSGTGRPREQRRAGHSLPVIMPNWRSLAADCRGRVVGCLACGQTVAVFTITGPPPPWGETCLKRLCNSVRSFVTNDMSRNAFLDGSGKSNDVDNVLRTFCTTPC